MFFDLGLWHLKRKLKRKRNYAISREERKKTFPLNIYIGKSLWRLWRAFIWRFSWYKFTFSTIKARFDKCIVVSFSIAFRSQTLTTFNVKMDASKVFFKHFNSYNFKVLIKVYFFSFVGSFKVASKRLLVFWVQQRDDCWRLGHLNF